MGTLLIVERELSTGGRVRLLLGAPGEAAEAYETAIRDAAATAEAHLQLGDAVSLESPELQVSPGEGRAHRRKLLTALARLPAVGEGTGAGGAGTAGSRSSPDRSEDAA